MVESFGADFLQGTSWALAPTTMLYCTLGVTLGMIVGVLPGVGIMATIALLMPFTFHLEPMLGIAMLAGIYYGAAYGGSTASILLNMPGTAQSAVTCLDGYPMSKQGRAGVALFMTTIASFVGSAIGIAVLVSLAFPLARLALKIGPQEYFAIMVLGLVMASVMTTGGSVLKSLAMTAAGVMIGLVGVDVTSGAARFTFGNVHFFDGLQIVAVALGFFGLAELVRNAGNAAPRKVRAGDLSFRSMLPTRDDWRRAWPAMFRGSGIGSMFGALPGTGGMLASFMSYAVERRVSKRPEEFGQGAIEGVSAPESANNAAIQTAFIPTLTLGIPGDAVMALMLGVFIIHGITPGPQMISNDPAMFWGLIVTFLFGNIILLILNIPLIGVWVRILAIPYSILFPAIIAFLCIGVYSVNYSVHDLYVLIAFGIAGYVLHMLSFPIAPVMLGMVLGPMMEENFRRAMILQRGDLMGFMRQPISATLLSLTALMLLFMVFKALRESRRRAEQKQHEKQESA